MKNYYLSLDEGNEFIKNKHRQDIYSLSTVNGVCVLNCNINTKYYKSCTMPNQS